MVSMEGFSAVFDLSVATHLASAVLFEVRSRFLGRYKDHVDYVKNNIGYLERIKTDPKKIEKLDVAIAQFDNTWLKAFFAVKPLLNRVAFFSLLVAAYSLGWLIAIGFSRELQFHTGWAILFLAIAIVPMPLFALTIWIGLRKQRADLKAVGEHLQNTFKDALGTLE